MKKTIKYLPEEKQQDLNYLVKLILEKIPQTQMIILYGSYATGKYVAFDRRIEFGIRTTYMSDYDILVVTSGAKDKEVGQRLDSIEEIYYRNPEEQTPVQFINDDIKKLNKDLSDGRYFYTQLKEEGIVLYNSGKFKLARRRKLNFDEIMEQAQEYSDEKFGRANSFMRSVKHDCNDGDYKMASFHLHQTCENLFYAVRLAFTLENRKQHNLSKLLASVRKYSERFDKIFPQKTKEEKRLFTLLKLAYVEARYNPKFAVTKEDIDVLIPIVESLNKLIKKICTEKIAAYGAV
ncbi:MAG: HEPN domain-containing protein [Prevotellaceae bacterium]|jgi:HEPN domain-containing protein/predicted nucleotidyltransferase|nr:HEPN domain-containing protein [Prevotellaceae bacterium]